MNYFMNLTVMNIHKNNRNNYTIKETKQNTEEGEMIHLVSCQPC
jgi:hypothetical protein